MDDRNPRSQSNATTTPVASGGTFVGTIRWIALAIGVACLALLTLVGSVARAADTPEAAALLQRHDALRARMDASPFGRPLAVDSDDDGERVQGAIHGEIAHTFAPMAARLSDPAEWCAIVVLHLNVKGCTHERTGDGEFVTVYSGRKEYTPIERAHAIRYRFRVAAVGADHVRIVLAAPSGPLATRDYELAFEAVPVGGRTFVSVHYAFRTSVASRVATSAYLATAGSGKAGFTIVGRDDRGRPAWIGGVRGLVERNAMRNFLALDAWLATGDAPAGERFARSVARMAALTDRYPVQLAEMPADEYVTIKHREWQERTRPLASAGTVAAPRS